MEHGGGAEQRSRRIVIDCVVDGVRHDIDIPLPAGPDEVGVPGDVDLGYLRSITRDLVAIAARFAPDDGEDHVVDMLGVHYKSAVAPGRITWSVTYADAMRTPRSFVTDADTAAGAFWAVFWHHASVVAPLRVASVEAFCSAMEGLHPIVAMPLPDFAVEMARSLADVVGTALQIAQGGGAATSGAPQLPHVEPVRAGGAVPPLRAISGGRG